MTSLICAAVLVGLLIITQEKRIKTHAGMWYAGALAISAGALAFLIGKNTETFGYGVVLDLFGRGELATILFLYVMLAPVLPSKKRLTKAVYRIRGELAILGAFLIWPHNLYFGRKYFVQLVEDPGAMSGNAFWAAICSVILLLLLVVLTVTSFQCVRRKMKGRTWKRIQRLSYIFYALIYVHVLLILTPSLPYRIVSLAKITIYTLIFGCYLVLRVLKYFSKKKKITKTQEKYLKTSGIVLVLFLSAGIVAFGRWTKETTEKVTEEMIEETETNPAKTGEDSVLKDGVWSGEGQGYQGKVTVEVTVSEGAIIDVKVTGYADDPEYFNDAKNGVVKQILEQQEAKADAVSGATYSSRGILEAVENALLQAKMD